MPRNSPDSVICPKCGYDQSGIVDSWTDRCPMHGRCTECGLEFDWADVMDHKRVRLVWYAEHAPDARKMLLRTPGTIARLLYPPIYWKRVTVMMSISLRRLALWSLMIAFGMHLFASVFVGFGLWAYEVPWRFGSFSAYIQTYGTLGVIRLVFNTIFAQIAYMEFDPAGDPYFGLGVTANTHLSSTLGVPLPFAGMLLLWLVILLVIPTTRERAKLRGVHIARASILSMLAIFCVFELTRAVAGLMMWTGGSPVWMINLIPLFVLAFIVWILVFWGSAIRTGWRVSSPWVLLILGTIASILGGMVAALSPLFFV